MKRIMVVEDNQTNMYLMDFILRSSGYEVIKVGSGEECLDIAIKDRPDMILMDIQLPGIDGIETTKRIRESPLDGTIPIIAITSYAMSGDKEKILAMGCTGYIEKPINPETFLKEIEAYL